MVASWWGGDFNGHIAYVSTSSSADLGRFCGQDTSGRQLVKLAQQTELVICTGCVSGDLHAPPTYRATARTSATRPDHILVSSSLHACIQSVTVATELKGSDHYSITTSLALSVSRATISESLHLGVPLRQVHWKGGCRLDYVRHLELAAPALGRCADLALVGHVEQAMNSLSRVLGDAAHAADMRMHTVRLSLRPGLAPTNRFMTRNVLDSSGHGGVLVAYTGFLPPWYVDLSGTTTLMCDPVNGSGSCHS